MSLEFLVENMSEEGFTKIDDALDIYTNERGEHYMFVTKKVPLPTELLNDEERWTFEGQKHFKIVLSLRLDASHCIVYNSVAKIYSYESTKILTGCGFNIHAPFRLDSHCHYLQECAFNDYILRHTAEAIGENLIYRLKSLDIREIYKIVYFEKRDVGILKYFYSYLADALQDRGIFYAYGPGKYMCPGEVLIACDEDLQLFGETLYEDKKLLISVEQKYEKWLIENFHMQRLRVADVLENIESIVQCDLFDDKLLGRVYSYLLANADLESEALHQKKILPVFDQDQILFVSGFEEDVYYLYDAQEAFSFAPNLKEKIDTLHEIVTFPDTFNRYEELGIKEYNQRNILQKLKKISQSTEDRTLKTEISKAILNQRKIDAENWNIVQ
ncbi:MAG TPA: hypothetical protein ENL02_01630, partial [Epsilonproteobacteria bacterium]|nr:hypothetical protein [Campylobacterota bacterium]